jgi:hypothetical protein
MYSSDGTASSMNCNYTLRQHKFVVNGNEPVRADHKRSACAHFMILLQMQKPAQVWHRAPSTLWWATCLIAQALLKRGYVASSMSTTPSVIHVGTKAVGSRWPGSFGTQAAMRRMRPGCPDLLHRLL